MRQVGRGLAHSEMHGEAKTDNILPRNDRTVKGFRTLGYSVRRV